MENHDKYIRRCIALAQQAIESGNPPFGAILVRGNEVISEAHNTQDSENNFRKHAEFNLLEKVRAELVDIPLEETILYSSNEPCAMCAGAMYWCGISKVVFGCRTETLAGIRGSGLIVKCQEILTKGTRPVEVIGPVLEDEVVKVLRNYWPQVI